MAGIVVVAASELQRLAEAPWTESHGFVQKHLAPEYDYCGWCGNQDVLTGEGYGDDGISIVSICQSCEEDGEYDEDLDDEDWDEEC